MALASICSDESWGRVVFFPEGSPSQGGPVADDEGHLMAEVLELAHLLKGDRMAQVQVGARGVDAQLDVERPPLLELFLQVVEGHDLLSAGRDDAELFFNGDVQRAILSHSTCWRSPSGGVRK